jgi:hypothetical protein
MMNGSTRKRFLAVACGTAAWLSGVPSVTAHHDDRSQYDPENATALSGTVVRFSFQSPHALLSLEAENEIGNLAIYEIELDYPGELMNYGISRNTFRAGEKLSVTVWRKRADNHWLYWGRGFRTEDGTEFGLIPPAELAGSD